MMLPRWISVIVLLTIGTMLLMVTHRGYRSGEVRAGSSLGKPYRPTRADNPIAFHFFLALYFSGGLALCVWGLLAMVGMAPPLRLQ